MVYSLDSFAGDGTAVIEQSREGKTVMQMVAEDSEQEEM
jgi:hypothetical protein